jgi:hypothetical protein
LVAGVAGGRYPHCLLTVTKALDVFESFDFGGRTEGKKAQIAGRVELLSGVLLFLFGGELIFCSHNHKIKELN